MSYNQIDPITEPVPGHPSGTRFKFHQKKLWRGVGGESKTKFDVINWAIKINLSTKKKDSKADISSLASLRIRPSLLGTLF